MEYIALGTLYIAGLGISWHQWKIIQNSHLIEPHLTWRGYLRILLWPIFGIKLAILYPWEYLTQRLRNESISEEELLKRHEGTERLMRALFQPRDDDETEDDMKDKDAKFH